jgi:hypothetical protein
MDGREIPGPSTAGPSTAGPFTAGPPSAGPSTVARVGAKCEFFSLLDTDLAAAGHPVDPPAPAPAPGPALSFEAWVDLTIELAGASPEDVAAALPKHGLTPDTWRRLDAAHRRDISDDLRAGRQERAILYSTKHAQAAARDARPSAPAAAAAKGTPVPPVTPAPPVIPTPQPVPEALRSTTGLPELPSPVMADIGRMPFVPPPPVAPFKGKAPAKTTPSKAVVPPVGSETMPLNDARMRPTPTTPFDGSAGNPGVGYVAILDARQYVALCAELALAPAPREKTLARYRVPTEAAFRALEEEWGRPARRGELEWALGQFAIMVRALVLR